jgi:hypothetical protein
LTSSIRFHELVSEHLLTLEKEIRALENRFVPFSELLNSAGQPEKLREQLSRYTMDSERLVHLSVLGHHHGDVQDGGDVDLFDDGDVELFGDDNVELFGDDNVELFDDQPPASKAGEASTSGKKPSESDEDLGDNVELF